MRYLNVKESMRNIINLLSKDILIKDFILVGGTAIILHINHRLSEDIDLFTQKKYIDNDQVIRSISIISNNYKVLDEYENYIEFFVNEVKVTFYSFGMPINNKPLLNNLNIATLNECATMKAHAITMRTSFKDYYDMYSIIKEGFSLTNIIEETRKKYNKFNVKIFLEKLLIKVQEDDLQNMKYKVSNEEIQNFMKNEVTKLFEELQFNSYKNHR